MNFSVNSVAPEDISKSLIKFAFKDSSLGEEHTGFELEYYGHGFQRSMIYELIRLAPNFKKEKTIKKKEFNPSFNLILFEEPEVFLHPNQQENMAYHLRRLAIEDGQQVIITTHSPIFVGKAIEQINQVVRVERLNGITKVFQPKGEKVKEIFEQGGALLKAIQDFVDNPNIEDNKKKDARKMIVNPPADEIAIQEENFRFQLWLDGERSSLFFANKVLLVEGATERALFNYLLVNNWYEELSSHRICVIDVLGKYNFHRYMALFQAYGILHGVVLDDDDNKNHHKAINDLIESSQNEYTLANPIKFSGCLETFLGLTIPSRDDKKPIEILKAITNNSITNQKLEDLKTKFCLALSI